VTGMVKANEELLDLLKYEQASLTTVRGCTSLATDAPLFTALLNYRYDQLVDDDEPVEEKPEADGLQPHDGIVDLGEGQERTNYPITMAVDDKGNHGFDIVAQVYDSLSPDDLLDYYECTIRNVLLALEENPETGLSKIEVLSSNQRERVLYQYNITEKNYPKDIVIHEWFEAKTREFPESIALVYDQQTLTYAELNTQANQLAHYLVEKRVTPDTLIGLYMDRSIEMVVGILGIVKAGAAYVPLDPSYPHARLAQQLSNARIDIVLMQSALATTGVVLANQAVCLDDAEIQTTLGKYPSSNPNLKELGLGPRNLAYVIYTSGSTGVPKGVMIEHQALVNRIDWMQNEYPLAPDDRVLQKTPFSFDVSVWEFFWPLAQGSCLVIAKPDGHKEVDYLVDTIKKQNITVLHFVPSMLRAMLTLGDWASCSSVRRVFCSGEALPKELQDQFFATGTVSELHNLYGPTEAAIDVSYWACRKDSEDSFVPIGKPIQNINLYVVDSNLNLVPPGVTGELLIGGVGLARGYLNQADLTNQIFIRNLFSVDSESRLYKTGDLVRHLPGGELEYVGRVDHQVKLRGLRIEPGEIETRLCEIETINDAAVVVQKSASAEEQLVAYVTPVSADIEIQTSSLRDSLMEHMPVYMVPAAFVVLESMPLTVSGKTDRKALPAPEGDLLQRVSFEAPIGTLEVSLANICQELLSVDRVGRNDSFFGLGGNSLNALRLIAELNLNNYKLSLAALYEHETIARVAQHLESDNQIITNPVLLNKNVNPEATPVFLVHEVSGELFYYRELATLLESSYPVYGLQLIGSGISLAGLTVQSLATEYIRNIKRIQPTGSYRIAGWSFGGIVAYEIAYQLLGEGESVEFVGLIDSDYDASPETEALIYDAIDDLNDETDDAFGVEVDISPLSMFINNKTDTPLLPPSRLDDMAQHPLINKLFKKLAAAGLDREQFLERINVYHVLMLGVLRYTYPALPIDVHLFWAPDPISGEIKDGAEKRWLELLGERIKMIHIGGDHETIIRAPYVRKLAVEITTSIENVHAQDGDTTLLDTPAVTIQNGNKNVNPLICIPGAGQSAAGFIDLAISLNQKLPVIAMQPKGLEVGTVPHNSIESAAEYYLEAIEKTGIVGPYRLLGHSLGGWVAFEMAKSLLEKGRKVELLTIVDAQHFSERHSTNRATLRIDHLMELIGLLEQSYDCDLGLTCDQMMSMDSISQLSSLQEKLKNVEGQFANISLSAVRAMVDTFIVGAEISYQSSFVFDGPSCLINAAQQDSLAGPRNQQLWSSNCVDMKSVTIADSNHISIIKSPKVEEIARFVEGLLV